MKLDVVSTLKVYETEKDTKLEVRSHWNSNWNSDRMVVISVDGANFVVEAAKLHAAVTNAVNRGGL